MILSNIQDVDDDGNTIEIPELPSNGVSDEGNAFGGNWLNFAIHLPQVGYLNPTIESNTLNTTKSTSNFSQDFRRFNRDPFPLNRNYFLPNNQPFVTGQLDTSGFARSDLHWTAFVETPKDILVDLRTQTDVLNFRKGFTGEDLSPELENKIKNSSGFKNGQSPCPIGGGKIGGNPNNNTDTNYYFYKGWDTANCLEYLFSLNIV